MNFKELPEALQALYLLFFIFFLAKSSTVKPKRLGGGFLLI
jgi:hypothetical protein